MDFHSTLLCLVLSFQLKMKPPFCCKIVSPVVFISRRHLPCFWTDTLPFLPFSRRQAAYSEFTKSTILLVILQLFCTSSYPRGMDAVTRACCRRERAYQVCNRVLLNFKMPPKSCRQINMYVKTRRAAQKPCALTSTKTSPVQTSMLIVTSELLTSNAVNTSFS
jgi:hypothetical protein